MSDQVTPPAPAPATVFDGRSFVPVAAPAGESPSPSDGKDVGGAPATDDVTTPTNEDGGDLASGADDGQDDGGARDDGRVRSTFWDQTPEDKRPERFNNAMERSNSLAAKVAEYEAKLAKYERGEGPKPTAAETPATERTPAQTASLKSASELFQEAIQSTDVTKLSPAQKQIRQLSVDTFNLQKQLVEPAQAHVEETSRAVDAIKDKMARKEHALEEWKSRSTGDRAGLYDAEIQELEADIRGLDNQLQKAEFAQERAERKLRDAREEHATKLSVNRSKATRLAEQEADEAASQKWYREEEARLDGVWNKTLNDVFVELKIPKADRDDAIEIAYARVKKLNDARGDDNPLPEAEWKGHVKQALARFATRIGSAEEVSEIEAADVRARATDQPGPKKRVASGPGDAKPKSKEEAFANLNRVMKNVRFKAAS